MLGWLELEAVASERAITEVLTGLRKGNRQLETKLVEMVYPELHKLARYYMRHERPNHTLQPTGLLHEAFVKLLGSGAPAWQDRAHFYAVAARVMRQILVDHARGFTAGKRGGQQVRLALDDARCVASERDTNLIALDDALKDLEKLDPRAARVVELRFFGGLTEREAAEVLGLSVSGLKRDWQFARAWLFQQLDSGAPAAG